VKEVRTRSCEENVLTEENAWHDLEIEETLQKLETSKRGLTTVEAARRLQTYGANELEEEKKSVKLALLLCPLELSLLF